MPAKKRVAGECRWVAEQPRPSEPKHESASLANEADDEEAVRRLARHFLTTPPQPKKAAPKGEPKRKEPAKRRKG